MFPHSSLPFHYPEQPHPLPCINGLIPTDGSNPAALLGYIRVGRSITVQQVTTQEHRILKNIQEGGPILLADDPKAMPGIASDGYHCCQS